MISDIRRLYQQVKQTPLQFVMVTLVVTEHRQLFNLTYYNSFTWTVVIKVAVLCYYDRVCYNNIRQLYAHTPCCVSRCVCVKSCKWRINSFLLSPLLLFVESFCLRHTENLDIISIRIVKIISAMSLMLSFVEKILTNYKHLIEEHSFLFWRFLFFDCHFVVYIPKYIYIYIYDGGAFYTPCTENSMNYFHVL